MSEVPNLTRNGRPLILPEGEPSPAARRLQAERDELLAVAKLALDWMRMTPGYVTGIEVEDRLAKAIAEADRG